MNGRTAAVGRIASISKLRFSAVFVLAMLLCGRSHALATELSSQFDSANKLYEQGKFAEAAARYEQLIQSGSVSPALCFNLGNAFFKAGEVGRALAAYRQAEHLAPRDPDLRANLQFVRRQVQGPTLAPDRWQRWLGRLTVNEWAVLASAAFWLWLLLLAAAQLRPALKPALRTLVWFVGTATLVLCICFGAVLSFTSAAAAIVVTRDAVVRNGPLDESPPVFTAHDGAELSVLDRKNDWLQVNAGQQRTGWLKADQVVLLSRG